MYDGDVSAAEASTRHPLGRGLHHALLLVWLLGPRYRCNLCGFPGRRFLDDVWHPGSICPACGSQVRHRLLAGVLATDAVLSLAGLVRDRRVLHFAPEAPLVRLFRRAARTYLTADLSGSGVDLELNIADMTTVQDNSMDLVVACDVLEHVPRDREAMREVRRVLAPGGWAIFTVPQCGAHEVTLEVPGVTDPRERERLYGQLDHVRMYGNDFGQRLADVGFQFQVRRAADLPPTLVQKHVLVPPVPSLHPLACNDRRVYFAQRA